MSFDNFFRNFWGVSRRDEEETQTPDLFQERFQARSAEAEEIMTRFEKQFETVFKSFMDLGGDFENAFIDRPPDQDASLRDRFLKDDEQMQEIPALRDKLLKKPDSERQMLMIPKDGPSFEKPQGWLSGLFHRSPIGDKDLDEDVLSRGIDELLNLQPSEMEPTFQSRGFSSKTSVTVILPDGKGEKRYSERDQYGNEITTVIRSIGDKQHHFTVRKNDKGVTRDENFVNLDEGNLKDFNNEFNASNRRLLDDRLGDFPLSDPSAPGIYQRLFGNFLPPSKDKK